VILEGEAFVQFHLELGRKFSDLNFRF